MGWEEGRSDEGDDQSDAQGKTEDKGKAGGGGENRPSHRAATGLRNPSWDFIRVSR